jgi:proto-chlorophyllide reductase subunit
MKEAVGQAEKKFVCPFAAKSRDEKPAEGAAPLWTKEAETRMERVPDGFMRGMTRKRIEAYAARNGVVEITPRLIEEKYAEWGAGSARQKPKLPWDDAALARTERIPDFVRGMVVLEIERCAREMGLDCVTEAAVDKAGAMWNQAGAFHSDGTPALYREDGEGRS